MIRISFIFICLLFLGILFVTSFDYKFNYFHKIFRLSLLSIKKNQSNNISNSCMIILDYSYGRIGNRMFMFASALGLALDYSCQLYINPSIIMELRQYFEINITTSIQKYNYNKSKSIQRISTHCTYFSNIFHSNNSRFIEIQGYWQSYRYFINHTDDIRYQLRFKQVIIDRVNNFLNNITNRSIITLVGIHIRLGDWANVGLSSSYNFISNAMTYFIYKYHSVNFIIVSDNKTYCIQKFQQQKQNIFLTPISFNPVEDMAVLTLCDHVIITIGTFGWWGGFLIKNQSGEILTDAKSDHSPININCNGKDFFPPWYTYLSNITLK